MPTRDDALSCDMKKGVRCNRVEVAGVKDPIPPVPFLQRQCRRNLPCGKAGTVSLTFSSVSWLVKGPWSPGNREEGVEKEGGGTLAALWI